MNDTRLLKAIESKDLASVKRLVQDKELLNRRGKRGRTPLHEVLSYGPWSSIHAKMIPILIHAGADVHARDPDGVTPMHIAAQRGNTVGVKLLLKKGVSVNVLDAKRQTPLHYAARSNKISMITLLAYHGAFLNAQNYKGSTPMHLAAKEDHPGVIRALIEAGANPFIKDNRGRIPLDVLKYRAMYVNEYAANGIKPMEDMMTFWKSLPRRRTQALLALNAYPENLKIRILKRAGLTPHHNKHGRKLIRQNVRDSL